MAYPGPGPDHIVVPSFMYSVVFFVKGLVPNPFDIRFSKVSGLSAEVAVKTISEGGQNMYQHKLPDGIKTSNLVLERGRVLLSPLDAQTNLQFSFYKFVPSHVVITLHNDDGIPLGAWMAFDAYPVKWSSSDLNADNTEYLIDTLELAYTRLQRLAV